MNKKNYCENEIEWKIDPEISDGMDQHKKKLNSIIAVSIISIFMFFFFPFWFNGVLFCLKF